MQHVASYATYQYIESQNTKKLMQHVAIHQYTEYKHVASYA